MRPAIQPHGNGVRAAVFLAINELTVEKLTVEKANRGRQRRRPKVNRKKEAPQNSRIGLKSGQRLLSLKFLNLLKGIVATLVM